MGRWHHQRIVATVPRAPRAPASHALLIVLLLAIVAPAQSATEAIEPDDAEIETVPVQVDGRTLFRVRGMTSVPAEERAARISQRIREAAADPAITDDSITVVAGERGPEIRAAGTRIMTVLTVDARLESVTPDILAAGHRASIWTAIERFRADRTAASLLRSALISVVATVALIAGMVALGFLYRRLDAFLERVYRARMEAISRKVGEDVMQSASLLGTMRGSLRTVQAVVGAIFIFLWLNVTLRQFPWTRWLGEDLTTFVLDPLVTIFVGIAEYVPNLLFLVVLAFVTRFGLRMLRLYFSAVERGSVSLPHFEREWALPSYKIARTVVLAIALVMAYPYLPGSGSEALRGLSVFAGLLISLGASSSVANLIAGYLTTFGRVFRVGDLIQVDDIRGQVTQVRLLTTRVRTIRNEEVTIPNSTIMSSSVTNFSALAEDKGLVLQTEVGIRYDVPWRQVHAMLLEAARRTSGLLTDPAPFVWQRQLGDFAVVYQLNVYKAVADQLPATYSELHQNILDVFNEHGVQIMTPAYEGDPETPKVVPKEQWFVPPAR